MAGRGTGTLCAIMENTIHSSPVVDLARKLVAIPSVNPLLAGGDASIAGEHRLAAFLRDDLTARGFDVQLMEITPGRPNLIARAGAAQPRRRVIIEAHLDTQGIQGMTVPAFDGEIRDGRLYGRGACDMKGPMAAALVNLNPDLLARWTRAGVALTFIGAIGEETGNIGALELVKQGIGADEILVLEPTDLHIVHAHKGAFWFEIEAKGLAAHGSNPDKGISAITGLGKVITLLQRQTDNARLFNELLGRPTVNFGMIQGGTSINIVPERCTVQVDRRTVPGETSDAILAKLRDGIKRLVKDGQLTDATVRVIKEGKPFETTADTRLVKRLGAACAGRGVTPVTEGAAWYSDAGPFSATCREVAVFGPGSIKQAHTADEFIEISELEKGAQIIGDFLDRLAEEVD